ncbi:DUF2939 domain-containing protein [Caulobacter sp. SLTY]|uniref:DUF2939 domain-containing protein n=1 Tax=Caulobacter sp. SLTY TaxID=2683262 RepID=UPI00141298C2|nr:DUF2939 domain-containing protein [Caulobacter sp. SLTY]NBB17335.1 DUF2939 domain-containing protein [Caulobacter sp. SLTY]
MRAFRTLTLIGLAAAALAGCATAARIDAAGDVHALLIAIRDNDKKTFNTHIDREALKSSIEARLMAEAEKATDDPGMRALGALAAPYLADAADKALIQPATFRSLAYQYGYKPGQPIPGQVAIAGALKRMPDGRVCATKTKNGPCVLIFTQRDGVWKLSGFEGEISDLRTKRR